MSDSDGVKDDRTKWVAVALAIVTIIVLVCLGYALQSSLNNWNESQQNSRQIKYETERYIRERCVGLDVINGIKCITDAKQSATNHERDESDLYAQRQMVVWAFIMAVTALISIPLSVAGVFFVWNSLHLTRRATKAAIDANTNTLLAIDQEQTNAQRQLRAYIHVDEARISYIGGIDIEAVLKVRNFGNTPAKKVIVWYEGTVTDRKDAGFSYSFNGDYGPIEVAPPNRPYQLKLF